MIDDGFVSVSGLCLSLDLLPKNLRISLFDMGAFGAGWLELRVTLDRDAPTGSLVLFDGGRRVCTRVGGGRARDSATLFRSTVLFKFRPETVNWLLTSDGEFVLLEFILGGARNEGGSALLVFGADSFFNSISTCHWGTT